LRILFALPGFHRYDRGAEVALLALAAELARTSNEVTVIGSGAQRPGVPYRFIQAKAIGRERFERFPKLPPFRGDTAYEEASFTLGLASQYEPSRYDITVTCSYPFTNWMLRRPMLRGRRPPHVFVTQNGDWPARNRTSEFRWFGCEGLVCTNPDYYHTNSDRWRCALIPNGIDLERFKPGPPAREAYGLPRDAFIVLMVSALIASKRVAEGIETVSKIPGAHLVVAGDGPLRDEIGAVADRFLPGRFTRLTVGPDQIAGLYRSADVFLHLSRDESFGNVYLEALACGLPIVAHDISRVRWIVGSEASLLDTADLRAVSAALVRAKERRAAAMRDKRIQRASEFSWQNVAGRYAEFFEEVVSA
jgi:glycosyltransferase involved in cell wall biosynthesis